jgi:hypothetical protein
MNGNSEKSSSWSWFWNLLILLFVIGLLLAIAVPGFIVDQNGIKRNRVFNNLRQIDDAKNLWAFEHGATNSDQIARLTNQLSEQDLIPYLHFTNKQGGLVPAVAGEIYAINPLNKSPEAKIVRKNDMPWPKGSIIRISENPKLIYNLEIIFPDGTKTNY